jgi:hypothetical protein
MGVDGNDGIVTMSEESPKVVNMDTPELAAFFSESEFPSESELASFPAARVPSEISVADTHSGGEPIGLSGSAAQAGPPAPQRQRGGAAHEWSAAPASGEQPADNEHPPAVREQHVGPATVTEFPIRPQSQPAVALSSLAGPVTLVDLIERSGGLEWREAVAVIQQICLYLKANSPNAPILLDPRTIQISDKGEVQLLSGQTSSDPLVIQVGRLLRSMLMGKESPPELRLLLSQATFELPIFESIEDVDRALAQINKLDEPGPAGLALLRAIAAPPKPPSSDADLNARPPSVRSILPARSAAGRKKRPRRFGSIFAEHATHVGAIFVAIAAIALLLWTRPPGLFPEGTEPVEAPQAVAPIDVPVEPTSGSTADGTGAPVSTSPATPTTRAVPSVPPDRLPRASTEPRGVVVVTPLENRIGPIEPPRPFRAREKPTATLEVMPRIEPAPSKLKEIERQAAALRDQGRASAASMASDSLVMSNPLYEPRTGALTPEGLSAFRSSQRTLLPLIAQRQYADAITALAAGDGERALSLARVGLAIADRRIADVSAQLREQLVDLIDRATAAVAIQDQIVYNEVDTDVIPPQPLTRQMPQTGPIGVPPNRVGTLEMIIGRDGTVENVRLHTPLNRHHERMIVSPAKAWRYRPATRNGRPVRYRILVKVNLPESGTN